MNKSLIAAVATAASLLAAGTAQASDVHWSIGINLPPVATVISSAPVYAPAPIYRRPPSTRRRPRRWSTHPRRWSMRRLRVWSTGARRLWPAAPPWLGRPRSRRHPEPLRPLRQRRDRHEYRDYRDERKYRH